MEYIVCKKFNGLKRGTKLNCIGNKIYYGNKFLCYNTSQNAYDYLARNDDGNGYERFKNSHDLLEDIKKEAQLYNEAVYKETKDLTEEERENYKIKAIYKYTDVKIGFEFYNK